MEHCNRCARNNPRDLVKGLEDLEISGRVATNQTTALRSARLRRVKGTCCHSNSRERPFANAGVKKL